MYRIMMPQGRLIETSEIIFVKDTEDGLKTTNVDEATGFVFKTSTGCNFWVSNVSSIGAFGTRIGSIWKSLLTNGCVGLTHYTMSGEVRAFRITEETYNSLLMSINDISETDSKYFDRLHGGNK